MKYTAKLKVLSEEWKQSGETLNDALDFGLEWVDVKGKGTITVSNGKKTHEHLFNAIQIRRIISNKIFRNIWAKNLELYLK